MNKLSNFDLQIISKYLYNFNDFKKLIELNKNLKYYYHSTFNIINIPINYVLNKHEIRMLIYNLIYLLPNLNEIILNFTSDYTSCIDLNIFDNYILINYINFYNVLKYEFNLIDNDIEFTNLNRNEIIDKIIILYESYSGFKIKINFDFDILIEFNELIFKNYIVQKLNEFSKEICKINIIIKHDYITKNLLDYINNKCREYKNIKFIINIPFEYLTNINKIPDEYKNINNVYYTYITQRRMYFNNDDDYKNNIYIKQYVENEGWNERVLKLNIDKIPVLTYIKIRNKIKSNKLKFNDFEVKFINNKEIKEMLNDEDKLLILKNKIITDLIIELSKNNIKYDKIKYNIMYKNKYLDDITYKNISLIEYNDEKDISFYINSTRGNDSINVSFKNKGNVPKILTIFRCNYKFIKSREVLANNIKTYFNIKNDFYK